MIEQNTNENCDSGVPTNKLNRSSHSLAISQGEYLSPSSIGHIDIDAVRRLLPAAVAGNGERGGHRAEQVASVTGAAGTGGDSGCGSARITATSATPPPSRLRWLHGESMAVLGSGSKK